MQTSTKIGNKTRRILCDCLQVAKVSSRGRFQPFIVRIRQDEQQFDVENSKSKSKPETRKGNREKKNEKQPRIRNENTQDSIHIFEDFQRQGVQISKD